MEKKVDILIVGGGPAGIVSAVTAHKYYPDKKILVIKSVEKGAIPCGIPYMFASLKDPNENALGNAPLQKSNIDLVIDEVVKIERKLKVVSTRGGNVYQYEKLILAIGSTPILPPILPSIVDRGELKLLFKHIKRF